MAFQSVVRVLSKEDEGQIHEQTLKLLEDYGVMVENEEALELFKKHGARIDGQVVHVPRKLVEDCLATCPKSFTFTARNEEKSVLVGGGHPLILPSCGLVYIQELDGTHRLATSEDYINVTKIYQAMDNVDIVGYSPVAPSDIDPEVRHLFGMYNFIKHSNKPIHAAECQAKHHAAEQIEMLDIVFGKDHGKTVTGIAPGPLCPLHVLDLHAHNVMEFAKRNQIVFSSSASMAGVNAPLDLAASVVQSNAEILSLIMIAQMVNPGAPVVYNPAGTVGELRSMTWLDGSPDGSLIKMAGVQMGRDFYHLPTRGIFGGTDSKLVDCQSGYETAQNILTGFMCGSDFLFHTLGVMNSMFSFSYEKLLIDIEIIDRARRLYRGLDTSNLKDAAEFLSEVKHTESWTMHDSTAEMCREMWQPFVSDNNTSYNSWVARGSQRAVDIANKKYKEILANAPEMMIDSELDKDLRAYMALKTRA